MKLRNRSALFVWPTTRQRHLQTAIQSCILDQKLLFSIKNSKVLKSSKAGTYLAIQLASIDVIKMPSNRLCGTQFSNAMRTPTSCICSFFDLTPLRTSSVSQNHQIHNNLAGYSKQKQRKGRKPKRRYHLPEKPTRHTKDKKGKRKSTW